MTKRQRGRGRRPNNNNNNPNRSLDSNGPDVRVRGSAQTIYDKYITLARDAKISGSRVKAENYLQHAEHYLRIVQEQQAKAQAHLEQQQARQKAHQKNMQKNAEAAEKNREDNNKSRSSRPSNGHKDSEETSSIEAKPANNGAVNDAAQNTADIEKPKPRSRRRKPVDKPVTETAQSAETPAAE